MATTNLSAYDKSTIPNSKGLRFGIVVSQWNDDVTSNLHSGALETLLEHGVSKEDIISWEVPGSYELIYGASQMLRTQELDAVLTIGCVIQGETKHFDFVCEGVTQGIKDLNVQQDVPVIFCVLTDNTKQQSLDRSGGALGNKGVECAVAALKMAHLRKMTNLEQ
ncbi:MAG: 6,7-dimethyl-8-ribityllumazine synthase [Flavobacteriaceae bacterium]